MAFTWGSAFKQFNRVIVRKQVASIVRFKPTLVLVSPPESSSWQEPIELAYALAFLSSQQVDDIMAPIRHGFAWNFIQEGSAEGPWDDLADSTVEEREQWLEMGSGWGFELVPGFSGTNPILQRTGEYKMSWVDSGHPEHGREDKSLGMAGREIWEGSADEPRAHDLSMGVKAQNLPARPVAPVEEQFETAMKARIDALLTKYIQTVRPVT